MSIDLLPSARYARYPRPGEVIRTSRYGDVTVTAATADGLTVTATDAIGRSWDVTRAVHGWFTRTDASLLQVDCPCCGDPMHAYRVVCVDCYSWTAALIPGQYYDATDRARADISATLIATWTAARDARIAVTA